ncbi:MAG: hypothetical protein ACR2J3_13025 [Aridibacter sp.]
MSSDKSLLIRPLEPKDAGIISTFLELQPPDYMSFFYAFDSNESKIAEILSKSELDVYSGIFWQNKLVGIFMLRGWDAGYEIPSYGVLISEKYRGKSLFDLTIDAAKLICKLSGAKKLMVKMHADRISPKGAKRLGLYKTDFEESTGNIIYHLDL